MKIDLFGGTGFIGSHLVELLVTKGYEIKVFDRYNPDSDFGWLENSDFRKDIKRYFDKVTQNFETLIINRGKDNGVVIMSLAEYNSLCATQHELSSQQNEKRLDSAIAKLKSGNSRSKNLLKE